MFRCRLLSILSLALLTGILPIFFQAKVASGAGTLPAGFAQSHVVGVDEPHGHGLRA